MNEDEKKIKKLNQKIQSYNYKCFAFDEKYKNTDIKALLDLVNVNKSPAYFFGDGLKGKWAFSELKRIKRKEDQLCKEYIELLDEKSSVGTSAVKPFWKVERNWYNCIEFHEKNEESYEENDESYEENGDSVLGILDLASNIISNVTNEFGKDIAIEKNNNEDYLSAKKEYERAKWLDLYMKACVAAFAVTTVGVVALKSAVGIVARKSIVNYITHTAIPTIVKLGAAKVLGGLGIGLLGWQVAAAVGAALLAYGLYRGYKRYQYKRFIAKPKTEVVVTEDPELAIVNRDEKLVTGSVQL
jgi:hypothetical protein